VAFKMEDGRIYKCWHVLKSKGSTVPAVTDPMLIQGVPNLILKWELTAHEDDHPAVTVPVDPARLKGVDGSADCTLEGEAVQDPRDVH